MAEGFSNGICGLLCLGHWAEFGPSQQWPKAVSTWWLLKAPCVCTALPIRHFRTMGKHFLPPTLQKTGTGQAGRWKGWHTPQPLGTEPEGKRVIWLHGSPAANTWAHQPRGCKATGGTAPPQPRCSSAVVSMNHWLLGRGFCHTGWKTWQGMRQGWLGWRFSLKQHKDLEYYNIQERRKSSVP